MRPARDSYRLRSARTDRAYQRQHETHSAGQGSLRPCGHGHLPCRRQHHDPCRSRVLPTWRYPGRGNRRRIKQTWNDRRAAGQELDETWREGSHNEWGVRDTAQLRELGFPVWTTSIVCTGTTKSKAGWVNAPAVCAGALVEPGDLIVADDDGVVVIKREDIPQALEKSLAREKKEQATTQKIEEGQLGIDFYGFREVLTKLGVRYYDTLEDADKSLHPKQEK